MKTKVKLGLKKTLKIGMALDRRFIRLLGGRKHFKPQAVNLSAVMDENELSILAEVDGESFKNYQLVSKPPAIARIYIRVRNKVFLTAYHTGKELMR